MDRSSLGSDLLALVAAIRGYNKSRGSIGCLSGKTPAEVTASGSRKQNRGESPRISQITAPSDVRCQLLVFSFLFRPSRHSSPATRHFLSILPLPRRSLGEGGSPQITENTEPITKSALPSAFPCQRFSFDSLAARKLTATSRRPVHVAHPSRSIQLSDFSCQISEVPLKRCIPMARAHSSSSKNNHSTANLDFESRGRGIWLVA